MGYKITAPSEFSGRSTYGSVEMTFDKGVAEVEKLPKSLGQWLKDRGYKITSTAKRAAADTEEVTENDDA